jgi:hypothetical protein
MKKATERQRQTPPPRSEAPMGSSPPRARVARSRVSSDATSISEANEPVRSPLVPILWVLGPLVLLTIYAACS